MGPKNNSIKKDLMNLGEDEVELASGELHFTNTLPDFFSDFLKAKEKKLHRKLN